MPREKWVSEVLAVEKPPLKTWDGDKKYDEKRNRTSNKHQYSGHDAAVAKKSCQAWEDQGLPVKRLHLQWATPKRNVTKTY